MPAEHALHPAALELARRLGASSQGDFLVHLSQTGRMRQDEDSRWMHFRASQTIRCDSCCFEWRARTGPLGMVSVEDTLTSAGGKLTVRALGFVALAGANPSPELTRGELMRYLAEIPWAPHSILRNPQLRWRTEGPDELVVTAGYGDTAAEVSFTLNRDGMIQSTYAPDRPRAVKGGAFIRTPWRGTFSDYRVCGTTSIPFAAEVGWETRSAHAVCWEGKIVHWQTVPESRNKPRNQADQSQR